METIWKAPKTCTEHGRNYEGMRHGCKPAKSCLFEEAFAVDRDSHSSFDLHVTAQLFPFGKTSHPFTIPRKYQENTILTVDQAIPLRIPTERICAFLKSIWDAMANLTGCKYMREELVIYRDQSQIPEAWYFRWRVPSGPIDFRISKSLPW